MKYSFDSADYEDGFLCLGVHSGDDESLQFIYDVSKNIWELYEWPMLAEKPRLYGKYKTLENAIVASKNIT